MECGCRVSEGDSSPASGHSTRALSGSGHLLNSASRSIRDTVLRFLALSVPLLAITLLYWPTALALASMWNDTEARGNTHGWLIVLVTLWLLWQLARDLPSLRLLPFWPALPVLLVLSLAWLVLFRTSIQTAQIVLLPLMMLLAMAALYGSGIARRSVFAIGYLYFATPIWGYLTPVLQWGTIFANRFLIRAFGIPASFVENTVRVPSGVFAIEGGCAGSHFFIVAIALAALYAHLRRTVAWVRLLMLAAGLAILANWIRVFTIVVAGYLTNMQHYLVTVDHYYFGWGVFALTMVVFFVVAARFRERPVIESISRDESVGSNFSSSQRVMLGAVLLLLVVLAAGPLSEQALARRSGAPLHDNLLPGPPEGWEGPLPASSSAWQPVFEGADTRVLGRYTKSGRVVEWFSAEYSDQHQHKKLAGYYNSLTGVERVADESSPPVDLPAGFAQRATVDERGRQTLIWYSYYVGERRFSSALKAQIRYGLQSLFSQPVSGVMALRTTCENECTNAARTLLEFAARNNLDASGPRDVR